MPIKQKLTGSGLAPLAAQTVVGTLSNSLQALTTSQTTALVVYDDINIVTLTTTNGAVILRSDLSFGDTQTVVNYGGATLSVYPPISGMLNNLGTTNVAVTVNNGASAEFHNINGLNFFTV